MPLSSSVRTRVVSIANRLLALRQESTAPLQAVNALIAAGVVPGPALTDAAAPFSSAIRRVTTERGASIAAYLQAAEQQANGDAALRFLSQLDAAGRRWQGPLLLAAVEFAALLSVMLIYGLFVLPQFRAVFESAGARLPEFTEWVATLFSPASPLAWLIALVLAAMFAWRFVAPLLGPLAGPLDRLAFALPEFGAVLREGNSLRLSGWLGHGPPDASGGRLALEAARTWHPRSTLTRACARVLARIGAGGDPFAALADSPAFDRELRTTAVLPEPETKALALRSRWRAASQAPEPPSSALAKLVHALIVAAIGAVIIALYLPIFKLGAMS